uniref:Uncharacterized protein n=1 Tax=Panagrolaimus superbus TaxID=310955 RepID=A0A914Z8P4_9BILA
MNYIASADNQNGEQPKIRVKRDYQSTATGVSIAIWIISFLIFVGCIVGIVVTVYCLISKAQQRQTVGGGVIYQAAPPPPPPQPIASPVPAYPSSSASQNGINANVQMRV